MKERNLVTGARGFLGSSLTQRLESQGHQVFKGNREGLVRGPVDRVFDLASYGNYHDQTDLHEVYKANVLRVISLLETADDANIVLTSTSAIDLPHQSFYAASKSAMEKLAYAWVQERGGAIVVVRPSSITGKGEQARHLIPTLIRHAYSGEPMDLVKSATHDYLDIEDFIDALLLVSKNANRLSGYVVNISSGKTTSNLKVKNLVEEITGKKINIKEVESLRAYDSTNWEVPNNKMLSLGWKPKKSLADSIREMI